MTFGPPRSDEERRINHRAKMIAKRKRVIAYDRAFAPPTARANLSRRHPLYGTLIRDNPYGKA